MRKLFFTPFIQVFEPKIQDFFQTFFQNNYFFFHTQGYQIGQNEKKKREHGCRLNKIWLKRKKNHIWSALVVHVALKKIKPFCHFSRFNLHFPDFFRSGELLGKFQDLLRNSMLCTNPVFSVSYAGISEEKNLSSLNRVRTYDLLVSS